MLNNALNKKMFKMTDEMTDRIKYQLNLNQLNEKVFTVNFL